MPLPFLTRRAPWFSFLGHFRNLRDMYETGGGQFLRNYCRTDAEFQRKMCTLPPLVIGEIQFGLDAAVRGELVAVMRRPEDMLQAGATKAVVEAVKLSADRGAKVIGLGALTSPATGGGLRVLKHLPSTVTVTNGNAYTAAIVRTNVLDAARSLGLGRPPRVAIVGCTGSVGGAASRLVAESGADLILVGRTVQKIRGLLPDLVAHARCSDSLVDARDADIVVLLTSDPSALLRPGHVRHGTIVLDFAQPANVQPDVQRLFEQAGVPVEEGGKVRIPNYSCSFDLDLGDRRDTIACLAETYLFACEGIREHSVGRPTVEFAKRMEAVAERRGVRPSPLRPSVAFAVEAETRTSAVGM